MAWNPTQPSNPKYRTPEHRAERERWVRVLNTLGSVQCAQPECMMADRTIWDGQPWHLGHDDAGTSYIGPCHPQCNVRDGARRGNRRSRQPLTSQRWAL